jgi:hypothetical protein
VWNATISTNQPGLVWANGKFTVTPGSPYAQFVANHGWPALAPGKRSNPTASMPRVTLCGLHHLPHQHVMTVYTSSASSPIQGDGGGKFYATTLERSLQSEPSDLRQHSALSTTILPSQFCQRTRPTNNTITTQFQ